MSTNNHNNHWNHNLRLAHISMHRFAYIIALIVLVLLVLPLVSHYYLNSINPLPQFDAINVGDVSDRHDYSDINNDNRFDDIDFDALDMKNRVNDLLTIRSSVRNELRQLESRRSELLREITEFSNKLDALKSQVLRKSTELDRIHVSLEQTKYAQKEALMNSNALLLPPLRLLPFNAQTNDLPVKSDNHFNLLEDSKHNGSKRCQMHNCFDYSRCSLFSPFLTYFYPLNDDNEDTLDIDGQEQSRTSLSNTELLRIRSRILDAFNGNIHVTFNPTIACIYVVVIYNHQTGATKTHFDHYLKSLPHWAGIHCHSRNLMHLSNSIQSFFLWCLGDGRNHIIINLLPDIDLHSIGVDISKAIIAQNSFTMNQFRLNFDIIIPHINYDIESHKTAIFCPARRKYLATYLGTINYNNRVLNQIKLSLINLQSHVSNNNELLFDFVCDDKTKRLCNNQTIILKESTFALILPPNNSELISNSDLIARLKDIISTGAIPVLIGGDYLRLPFDEVIDWKRAVICLPISRVTELHFVLRSYSDNDIIELRRNGQTLYSRHLKSINEVISTTFALIRQSRLQMPSPAVRDEQSLSIFNATNPMKFFDSTSGAILIDPLNSDNDENLGPIEPPFPSLIYQRNYSLVISNGYNLWNDIRYDPFTSYPSLPTDPLLPSDAKFIGSSYGFRPIGGGVGGSGKEFSEALGGNVPKEQFTIVMLTYEREAVLIDSLQRLKGLPHLNKILVIWNSPGRLPSADLRWPDVGAPILVLRSKRNSLNNRFLPYDVIETDAVLSMDDDAHLRHDEIVFGFRVWREARDRIVGFPGRYHAWDAKYSAFLYNSNYSCELSMVLTGAAFFHKYYSYLYTYSMPQAIRDKVDEYMNCEDIAMNFLVSHISRQPPIKVTSRWTFRCPGCPVSLSEDDSHFHERHKCINYFVSVYGYMPLLNTQFRADSVLFKTRIPHDKQKCFKFI